MSKKMPFEGILGRKIVKAMLVAGAFTIITTMACLPLPKVKINALN
jgi:hypothetical protein